MLQRLSNKDVRTSTLFFGFIGISFDNGAMDDGIAEITLLAKWLTPSINLTHERSNSSINSYEFGFNKFLLQGKSKKDFFLSSKNS
jgi:hypothetical protein